MKLFRVLLALLAIAVFSYSIIITTFALNMLTFLFIGIYFVLKGFDVIKNDEKHGWGSFYLSLGIGLIGHSLFSF